MKRKIRVFSSFAVTLAMTLSVFTVQPAVSVSAATPPAPGGVYEGGLNPYIPLWDYNPDTDPHVFHDPDNPGKFRLYLFNSHDLNTTNYCYTNQVLWSAPVEDLTKWTYHGVIASQAITGSNAADTFFAPTACEVDNHDGTYTYYYMPFINGGNKATLMMKSSRPDGPYEVINWSSTAHSATSATAWGGSNNFDPALFVDDDGRMYGIWGGYSRAISGAELDPQNPQNVKEGTSIVQVAPLYSQAGGTDLSVFEACALSKMTISGHTKYVMTYARRGLAGEPWGTTSAMKAYATADSPLGPYTYGGPLVYAGGEIVNGSSTFYTHNTHGNLFQVNGQWYISYHRATNNHGYSRQAMVEPVYPYWDDVNNKLVIPMAEVTSQGFHINGLDPYRTYSAGYTNYTTPVSGPYVAPNITGRSATNYPTDNVVVNLVNNALIGYKYFNFAPRAGRQTYFTADFTPGGQNGTITAYIGNPDKATDNAKQIGSIDITSAMPQVSTQFKIPTPLLDDKANAGKYPLFLRFTSSSGSLGTLNYIGFSQEEPPIPEGLVAWYKLDEASGTVAKDSSGNGKDAAVVGTPNWSADGGFVFSGGANNSSGNAIKIPNDILSGLSDVSVTFDVLVQPHTYSNVSCFTLGNTSAQTGYLTMRPNYFSGNTNATWAQFANTNTTTYTAQKTSSWLPRNVWQSVAVTLKGGDTTNLGRLVLYDDGVALGSATNVAQKPPATSSANYIGRSYTTTPSFKGIIRNFRIYNRELTADEVAALAGPVVTDGITADAEAIDLGNTSAVAGDLTLPTSGANSTTITWATSDASVITAGGVITRPTSGSSSAVLTATISRGGVSETRDFPITVMAVGDAADAAWDAGLLEVLNPDDIRGNITLPQTGELGSAVKWSCDSPGVITPTGEVTRPAYGEDAVKVVLTATATKGTATASKSFSLTVKPMPRNKPNTAYAMSLFKTNDYEGEKFYLHVSSGNNGLSFSAVNGGAPILESYMGTMGIRDPFIIRSHDGDKFYMLATDMSYPRFGNWTLPSQKGSRSLVCFESDDLIHWSNERLCMVSPDNVGNSWAPEALYLDSIGAYVVYWASKIYDNAADPNHTTTQNNRMFYSITRDFVNFTPPTEWFYEPGFNRIDTTAIKVGDTFYRFVKDDAASTNTSSPVTSLDVFSQKSTDFFAVPYTAWTNITEEIGRQALGGTRFSTGYEGPSIIKANPGDVNGDIYYLYLDRYIGSPGGICVCSSDSLDAAKWTGRTMTIPASSHHATVIALKQSERDALAGLAPAAVTSTTDLTFDKATYLATATVKASDGGQVAGNVVFSTGSWSATAKLNADGVATITVPDDAFKADGSVQAVYQGYGEVSGSEASVPVTFSLSFSASMSETGGTASVFADVFAGGANALAGASVIAAAYDPAGQMIAVSEKTIDLPLMGREIVPLSLDVSKAAGNYTVKAFLWDKATWAPLAGAVDVLKVKDPLVSSAPQTYCNPINISYRFQVDQSNPARWYRAIADTQPVYYKGEYWIFPTCASGYFYSSDLINWKFVLSAAPNIDAYAPAVFVLGDYLYVSRSGASPLYKSNDPHNGGSWTQVRTTSYQDPAYFMDPDTGRLFALTGCAGLTTTSQVAIRIVEIDTTSPTLAQKPVDTTKPGATSAGYAVNYLSRNIRGYEVPGQLNDNYATSAQSWLEGSGMIKHDGKYYVYYCGPGTEYAGYCDACYVADDPLGPYTWCDNGPFAYKSTGFTVGAAHGHTVYEQTTGRLWKFGTIAISNSNIFERRANLYPVNFNSKGQPETDLSFADYPMYVPLNPKGSYEHQGPGWSLLSFGAAATASSTYDTTVTSPAATGMAPFHITPGAAFDESIRTWWSAQTGDAGEWIMGDLGKVCTVRAAQVNFADQDAARISTSQPAARAYEGVYRYLFEYSVDGKNWYPIADRSNAVNPANSAQDYSHDYYELVTGIPMRYVRVTNEGPVPANGKFAISDIRLFGDGGGSAPGAVNDFTLSRVDGRDNRTVQVSWNPVDKADGGYVGYIVRFGVDPNDLNIHYQTINNTSVTIPILSTYTDQTMSTPVEYYFRIDTYNNSGVTVGTKVIKLQ